MSCFGSWGRLLRDESLMSALWMEIPLLPTLLNSFLWGWHLHFSAGRPAQSWLAEDQEPTLRLRGLLHTSITSETRWAVSQNSGFAAPPLWDGSGTWAGMPGSAVKLERETSRAEPELRPTATTKRDRPYPCCPREDGWGEGAVILRTLSCCARRTGFPGNLEGGQEPHPPKRWEKTTGNIAGKSSSHYRKSGCGLELKKASMVTQVWDFSKAAAAGMALKIRTFPIRPFKKYFSKCELQPVVNDEINVVGL